MKAGHHVKNAHREMMAVAQGKTQTQTHLRSFGAFFHARNKEMDGISAASRSRSSSCASASSSP